MSLEQRVRDARVAAASAVMQDFGWSPTDWDTPEAFDQEIAAMLEAADAVTGPAQNPEAFDRAVKAEARRLLSKMLVRLDD